MYKKSYILNIPNINLKIETIIGTSLSNKNGDIVGTILNASFNKKFKKLYLDVEFNSAIENSKSTIQITTEKNLIFNS